MAAGHMSDNTPDNFKIKNAGGGGGGELSCRLPFDQKLSKLLYGQQ